MGKFHPDFPDDLFGGADHAPAAPDNAPVADDAAADEYAAEFEADEALEAEEAVEAEAADEGGIEELPSIVTQLEAAQAAGDAAAARPLRLRWNELNMVWGLEVDDTLIKRVEPVLKWLHAEDARDERHAAAAAALELALDLEQPVEEIEPLYRAATRERELARGLEKRYRTYVGQIQRATIKRTRLAIVGSVLGGLLIVAMITGIVFLKIHTSRVQTAEKMLGGLLDAGSLEEAQAYLAQVEEEHPRVARNQRIQDLAERLQKMLKDDQERHEAFVAAADKVDEALAARRFDSDALLKARSLTRTAAETTRLNDLQEKLRKSGEEGQAFLDKQFLKPLGEFIERLGQLEADYKKDPVACEARIASMRAELRAIEERNQSISQTARDQAEPVWDRLQVLERGARGAVAQSSSEDKITAACGSPAQFCNELQAYIKRFPKNKQSAGFQQVIEEAPLWETILQWNVTIKQMWEQDNAKTPRKTAAEWVGSLNKLLGEHGNHPDAELFRTRLPYFEAVARRDGCRPALDALRKLVTTPLMTKAWTLEDKGGRHYYFKEDPKVHPNDIRGPLLQGLRYLAGADLSERQVTLQKWEIVAVGPAPQTALAEKIRTALDGLSDDNWERSFFRMAQTVHADPQTDALLRCVMLRDILTVGCQGSLPFQKAFQGHVEQLKRADISPTANWINPNDTEGLAARARAQQALAAVPDMTAAGRKAVAELLALHPAIGTEYQWVGWLDRGEGEKWQCPLKSHPVDFGQLVVLRLADGKIAVEPVGAFTKDTATVTGGTGPALVDGRPVFLVVPPPR